MKKIFALIIFIILAISAGFILKSRQKPAYQPFTHWERFDRLTPSPIPPTVSLFAENAFQKRLFDPQSMFISNIPYPSELTSISQENLLGIKCSYTFARDRFPGDKNSFTMSDFKTYQKDFNASLDDTTISGIYAKAIKVMPDLNFIRFCKKEDDTLMVIAANDFPLKDAHYYIFTFKKLDSSYDEWEYVKTNGVITNSRAYPYFSCRLLEFAENQKAYFQCESGDAGATQAALYSMNMATGEVKVIRDCKFVGVIGSNTGRDEIECSI